MPLGRMITKQQPDQARLEENIKALEAKLDAYETILSKQKYLGGDVRTGSDTCDGSGCLQLPARI